MRILNTLIESIKKRKNKRYTSCYAFYGGLTFMNDFIRVCCSDKCGIILKKNYKGDKIDFKEFYKIRKKFIVDCKKGNIPESCKGCSNLREDNWEENYKITEIVINNWDHCSCGCIYCIQGANSKFLSKTSEPSPYYSVVNKLEYLFSHNMVDTTKVHFQLIGGEIALLTDAEDIINICLKYGVGHLSLYSSCIIYSNAIEKALKECNDVSLTFSIDCASRELYNKIKRIDAFETVVDNIKKYASISENAKNSLKAKYIIIDGINDNTEELDNWLNLINSIGIKSVTLELNFKKYYNQDIDNVKIPDVYYEMYNLLKKRINEYNMTTCSMEFFESIIKAPNI